MDNPFNVDRKRYPVSLQCAAEAVFGPNERLRHLLRQSQSEPEDNERNKIPTTGLLLTNASTIVEGLDEGP